MPIRTPWARIPAPSQAPSLPLLPHAPTESPRAYLPYSSPSPPAPADPRAPNIRSIGEPWRAHHAAVLRYAHIHRAYWQNAGYLCPMYHRPDTQQTKYRSACLRSPFVDGPESCPRCTFRFLPAQSWALQYPLSPGAVRSSAPHTDYQNSGDGHRQRTDLWLPYPRTWPGYGRVGSVPIPEDRTVFRCWFLVFGFS